MNTRAATEGPGRPATDKELLVSLLHPGDTFPELSLTVPGGETVKVPQTFGGQFGVMLFLRGS